MKSEELQNYKHALKHLLSNKINDTDSWGGWYSGKKPDFIKRHEKAIKMFKDIIQDNTPRRGYDKQFSKNYEI